MTERPKLAYCKKKKKWGIILGEDVIYDDVDISEYERQKVKKE